MSKNNKTKSSVRKIRDALHVPGRVSEFKQVRPGTIRATIVKMAGRSDGAKIDHIVEVTKVSRGLVKAHLDCLVRDCGYGYKIVDDRATLLFPGLKIWRDAIGTAKAAARTKTAARAKAAVTDTETTARTKTAATDVEATTGAADAA